MAGCSFLVALVHCIGANDRLQVLYLLFYEVLDIERIKIEAFNALGELRASHEYTTRCARVTVRHDKRDNIS